MEPILQSPAAPLSSGAAPGLILSQVPLCPEGPKTCPQLLNGRKSSLGTRNVARPVSQDRPWPGLARWPRTVSWGWEWYPRRPQGDLASQGQPPGWGGLQVSSAPGIQAAWSLGTGVQGVMDSGRPGSQVVSRVRTPPCMPWSWLNGLQCLSTPWPSTLPALGEVILALASWELQLLAFSR